MTIPSAQPIPIKHAAYQIHHTQITPPTSFTSTSSPLTPPPSDEKPLLPSSAVVTIIEHIRRLQSGVGRGTEVPWKAYTLSVEDYDDLQQRLQSDELLAAFVEHKVRFVYLYLHTCMQQILTSAPALTTFRTSIVLSFECPEPFTSFSLPKSARKYMPSCFAIKAHQNTTHETSNPPPTRLNHQIPITVEYTIRIGNSDTTRRNSRVSWSK